MTIADERPKPPSRARGGFQFVHLSNPADAAGLKTLVRSHAARNPRRRKRNVVQHQEEKLAKEGAQKEAAVPALTSSREHGVPRVPRTGAAALPGPVVPLSAAACDPFDSFTRPLSRLECHLLDHFVNTALDYVITCLPFESLSEKASFSQGLASYLVQTAAADAGMLSTLLLAACQSLANLHRDASFSTLALMYKGQCIASINDALRREGSVISDVTLTKTLALAADAVRAGPPFPLPNIEPFPRDRGLTRKRREQKLYSDVDALHKHLDAAKRMVELKGGIDKLGRDGYIGKVILWCVRDPRFDGTDPCSFTPISYTVAGFVTEVND